MADDAKDNVVVSFDERNTATSSLLSFIVACFFTVFYFHAPVLRYIESGGHVVNFYHSEGASIPYLLHLPSFSGIRLASSHVGLGIYLHPSLPAFKSKRVYTLVETSLPHYAAQSRLPIILISPLRPRKHEWKDRHGLAAINRLHDEAMQQHALLVDKQRVFMIAEGDAGSAALTTVVSSPRSYAGLVFIDCHDVVHNLTKAAALLAHSGVAVLVVETGSHTGSVYHSSHTRRHREVVRHAKEGAPAVGRGSHTEDPPYTIIHAHGSLVRGFVRVLLWCTGGVPHSADVLQSLHDVAWCGVACVCYCCVSAVRTHTRRMRSLN